ncbi:hypothetical protein KCU88_g158, partial [Aureobasidium melanogenum]
MYVCNQALLRTTFIRSQYSEEVLVCHIGKQWPCLRGKEAALRGELTEYFGESELRSSLLPLTCRIHHRSAKANMLQLTQCCTVVGSQFYPTATGTPPPPESLSPSVPLDLHPLCAKRPTAKLLRSRAVQVQTLFPPSRRPVTVGYRSPAVLSESPYPKPKHFSLSSWVCLPVFFQGVVWFHNSFHDIAFRLIQDMFHQPIETQRSCSQRQTTLSRRTLLVWRSIMESFGSLERLDVQIGHVTLAIGQRDADLEFVVQHHVVLP